MAQPPGFRRLVGGGASSGAAFDPFVGLDDGEDPTPALDGELCAALFGRSPGRRDAMPMAYFTDHNCLYCRALEPRLALIADEVALTTHELPLLGPTSVLAARANLAAQAQDAGTAFRKALAAAPAAAASRASLAALASGIGIDPARLVTDMYAPTTDRALARSRALARVFGIPGTPALVVGRTFVLGAVGEGTLRRLVERERTDGHAPACA